MGSSALTRSRGRLKLAGRPRLWTKQPLRELTWSGPAGMPGPGRQLSGGKTHRPAGGGANSSRPAMMLPQNVSASSAPGTARPRPTITTASSISERGTREVPLIVPWSPISSVAGCLHPEIGSRARGRGVGGGGDGQMVTFVRSGQGPVDGTFVTLHGGQQLTFA